MYKSIIALDTGKIRGFLVEENLKNIEKIIKKYKSYEKNGLVIVFDESEILTDKKNLNSLVTRIRKAGFEIAIRTGYYEFFNVVQIKHWKPTFVLLNREAIYRAESDLEFTHKVNSLILFGKELNYSVIAEEIQTEKELQSVINLGINYGSGKLFRYNDTGDRQLQSDVEQLLTATRNKKKNEMKNMSLRKYVGAICERGCVMRPDEKASTAYDLFEKDKECSVICIVDKENHFLGMLTKTVLLHAFGGRYGYNLHMRNTVFDLANKDALIVYKSFSIENVSRLAMERSINDLYDPVVVLNHEKYYGIVTVKDLLSATVSIEVEKANEANPLTALPGNRVIEQKIHQLIGEQDFFAIIYLDLDNFKAFNDAYGFPNGDRMIEILAGAMKKVYGESAFLGHVGGDDFVIITRQSDVRERAELIIGEFKNQIRELYNETDWNRGYIIAQSRKGMTEEFPVASLSIAIITNQINKYDRMMELTEQIVTAKKKAKQIEGNSVVVL